MKTGFGALCNSFMPFVLFFITTSYELYKVGCVFLTVISAEFRMYRDDDHQEDTAFMMVADGGNFFGHQSCHHPKV